jgi:hypothetical protein
MRHVSQIQVLCAPGRSFPQAILKILDLRCASKGVLRTTMLKSGQSLLDVALAHAILPSVLTAAYCDGGGTSVRHVIEQFWYPFDRECQTPTSLKSVRQWLEAMQLIAAA